MAQQPEAAAPSSSSGPLVPLQKFDVLIAVRVYNAPAVTTEQMERVFDLDMKSSNWPEATIRTRTLTVEITGAGREPRAIELRPKEGGGDAGSKT